MELCRAIGSVSQEFGASFLARLAERRDAKGTAKSNGENKGQVGGVIQSSYKQAPCLPKGLAWG